MIDKLILWLHLCSIHGGFWNPEMSLRELIEEHEEEHEGPGGIRDHNILNLYYDLSKLKQILTEIYP